MPKNLSDAEMASQKADYIALAIPAFLIFLALELAVSLARGRKLYRINDAANSISLGVLMQTTGFIFRQALVVPYVYIWENYRVYEVPESPLTWLLLFLLVDFLYYWFHRYSHEVNILWSAHSVHHSAEEYNLSTALRQGAFQQFCVVIFYYPLAPFFSPPFFAVHSAINTLYQFWIHTKLIPKLGVFEYIINTPSQHRVHHGRNPYCIDKNYAGTLCIWDRLFGTFVEEKDGEEIKYGLVHELDSWSPLYDNLRHWVDMWELMKTTPSLWKKIQIPFRGPGWNPNGPDWDVPDVKDQESIRYNPFVPTHVCVYGFIHLLSSVLMIYELMVVNPTAMSSSITMSLLIVMTVICVGAFMDYKKYALVLETIRLLFIMSARSQLFHWVPFIGLYLENLRLTLNAWASPYYSLDAAVLNEDIVSSSAAASNLYTVTMLGSLTYVTLMHLVWYNRGHQKAKSE